MTLGPRLAPGHRSRATPFRYIVDAVRAGLPPAYPRTSRGRGVCVAVGLAAACLYIASRAFVRETRNPIREGPERAGLADAALAEDLLDVAHVIIARAARDGRLGTRLAALDGLRLLAARRGGWLAAGFPLRPRRGLLRLAALAGLSLLGQRQPAGEDRTAGRPGSPRSRRRRSWGRTPMFPAKITTALTSRADQPDRAGQVGGQRNQRPRNGAEPAAPAVLAPDAVAPDQSERRYRDADRAADAAPDTHVASPRGGPLLRATQGVPLL